MQAFYPQMLLMAGIVEVLGSALVILNVKFGSILLVSSVASRAICPTYQDLCHSTNTPIAGARAILGQCGHSCAVMQGHHAA